MDNELVTIKIWRSTRKRINELRAGTEESQVLYIDKAAEGLNLLRFLMAEIDDGNLIEKEPSHYMPLKVDEIRELLARK